MSELEIQLERTKSANRRLRRELKKMISKVRRGKEFRNALRYCYNESHR